MGAWFLVGCFGVLLVAVVGVGLCLSKERRENIVMFANKIGE